MVIKSKQARSETGELILTEFSVEPVEYCNLINSNVQIRLAVPDTIKDSKSTHAKTFNRYHSASSVGYSIFVILTAIHL